MIDNFAIKLNSISKEFNDPNQKQLVSLKNISLEIKPGEFFVFVGPSGSGKSTLLRIMSGLEKTYDGQVSFGPGYSHAETGFVFQQFALLPWLTVIQNVEMGLLSHKLNPNELRSRAHAELTKLGLNAFSHSYPVELSGGMKQRVGIARSLVTNPKIIFMDEPFSELDSFTAKELRHEIIQIWHERKPTIVMVTHIIEDAIELADRIAVLTAQPGKIEKIVEVGLPRPRQKRSESFYAIEDHLYKLIRP